MTILQIIQVVIAGGLITCILLQNRGSGLSGVFGGQSEIFTQKRGAEKTIFILTIILSIAFLGTALLSVLGVSF